MLTWCCRSIRCCLLVLNTTWQRDTGFSFKNINSAFIYCGNVTLTFMSSTSEIVDINK